jgi:hypothetical protein
MLYPAQLYREELKRKLVECWYNPKYNCTRNKAYCYDMNSAYAWGMLQPMPDTSVPPTAKTIVEGNEIGFIELPNNNDVMSLTAVFKGFCACVFPLMDSPFKKFVDRWYKLKQEAKTKRAYMKAKNYLVFSVGYMQRTNPYLRSAIVTYCNNYIQSLIDEDTTLFCNTDSIVSLKELDLKLGEGVGEWKVENKGEVAYVDFSYQWNKELPTYRGVPKSWFPKNWDILKHDIPHCGNKYYFDEKEIKIKRSKLWKNSLVNLKLEN